jgi:hypothetical protein
MKKYKIPKQSSPKYPSYVASPARKTFGKPVNDRSKQVRIERGPPHPFVKNSEGAPHPFADCLIK